MSHRQQTERHQIHRHTGGLEISGGDCILSAIIHRHIGGLENVSNTPTLVVQIHRHIGGLEKLG